MENVLIERLTALFAPWNAVYSESKVIPAITQATHLMGVLIGGGFAVAADRTTLRMAKQSPVWRAMHLGELEAVHRPVLIAIGVLFVSGVALAGADIPTFMHSPAFWIKLGFVALLLLNGLWLVNTENKLRAATVADASLATSDVLWHRLRTNAKSSLILWSLTLIAGAALVNVA